MAVMKTNVNVKIDADIKEHAIQLLERMGLDQTTAIDMFYRQIIAEKRLPFQPAVVPTLEEQLTTLVKKNNPDAVRLTVNEEGHILIDKDKNPDLYDWAING
jgi:DNA-damage-inducible protein J